MTRQDKQVLISALSEEFRSSSFIVVCDYEGLSVAGFETLRKLARDSGAKVKVVKNKLASVALRKAGRVAVPDLRGTNVFVWSNDQVSLSKLVCKFRDSSQDVFRVKLGCFDDSIVGVDRIDMLSMLPDRSELIGMLLSVWTAPARYFVTGLLNLSKQKNN